MTKINLLEKGMTMGTAKVNKFQLAALVLIGTFLSFGTYAVISPTAGTAQVDGVAIQVPAQSPKKTDAKVPGDDKWVTLPELVTFSAGRLATVEAVSDGKIIRWLNPNTQLDLIPGESGRWAIISSPTPGKYPIYAYTSVNDVPSRAARCLVVVMGAPDPTPPGPGPEPTPPGPTPVPPQPTPPGPAPDPAPIPVAGFRVLMVYDTNKADAVPLFAKVIRDYLNKKCVKGSDGQTPEWRICSKEVDTTFESAHWKAAMQRPRQSLPWMVVSNGKTGFEGPVPDSVDETLKILKKHGGE